MEIPTLNDLTQEGKDRLETPEIRVWCHPHKVGRRGDDYYYQFDTFKQALNFIEEHKEAEDAPLIAFRGKEINIFAI